MVFFFSKAINALLLWIPRGVYNHYHFSRVGHVLFAVSGQRGILAFARRPGEKVFSVAHGLVAGVDRASRGVLRGTAVPSGGVPLKLLSARVKTVVPLALRRRASELFVHRGRQFFFNRNCMWYICIWTVWYKRNLICPDETERLAEWFKIRMRKIDDNNNNTLSGVTHRITNASRWLRSFFFFFSSL